MPAEARASSRNEDGARAALARLETDGLVEPSSRARKTSRRWQQAMARAAAKLYAAGDAGDDLRVPIALAMVELCPEVADEVLAELVEAMLPIELASLGLRPKPGPSLANE
jgi:hypothetical protein